jgi:hypothetical protein
MEEISDYIDDIMFKQYPYDKAQDRILDMMDNMSQSEIKGILTAIKSDKFKYPNNCCLPSIDWIFIRCKHEAICELIVKAFDIDDALTIEEYIKDDEVIKPDWKIYWGNNWIKIDSELEDYKPKRASLKILHASNI